MQGKKNILSGGRHNEVATDRYILDNLNQAIQNCNFYLVNTAKQRKTPPYPQEFITGFHTDNMKYEMINFLMSM